MAIPQSLREYLDKLVLNQNVRVAKFEYGLSPKEPQYIVTDPKTGYECARLDIFFWTPRLVAYNIVANNNTKCCVLVWLARKRHFGNARYVINLRQAFENMLEHQK